MSSTAVTRPGRIITVLAAAGIVAALMQTLILPLVAELPTLLHTDPSNASWAITITLLTGAIATPVIGRLGDMHGKRRMLLVCVVPLVIGSVCCALADGLPLMVVGRAMQGMAMGMVPLGISAMRDLLPADRLDASIALMSSSMGIGGALGLPLSAAVAENASWHALFWGTAVTSGLVGILIWRLLPESPPAEPTRFDYPGAVGLAIGLACLLLAVTKGAQWGWTGPVTLSLFGAAVVVLAGWGAWELRTTDPLVDLRVTARRRVLLTNAASVVVGFAMYAQMLIAPQLLQLPAATGFGLGQSMLAAGLWMLPSGFMMMAMSPLGARISRAFGPKVTLLIGASVLATGYGTSLFLMSSTWGVLVFVSLGNAGVGLAYGAMPALIMSAVPQTETAAANGFNTLMRSIGTSLSAAVIGVVLAQMTSRVDGLLLPTETGFRTGLALGGAVALVAVAVIVTIPGRTRRTEPARPAALDMAMAR